jgi:hypothetical protein
VWPGCSISDSSQGAILPAALTPQCASLSPDLSQPPAEQCTAVDGGQTGDGLMCPGTSPPPPQGHRLGVLFMSDCSPRYGGACFSTLPSFSTSVFVRLLIDAPGTLHRHQTVWLHGSQFSFSHTGDGRWHPTPPPAVPPPCISNGLVQAAVAVQCSHI